MPARQRIESGRPTREAGARVHLAELRREELLALRDAACRLALTESGLEPAERRARLDGCKTAVAIHEALTRFEEQHAWLPTDAVEERDWQQLLDRLIATAHKHRLPSEVLSELLEALGQDDGS